MALISCVECGKEFSDKAKACPNCGCPIEYIIEVIENQKAQQEFADHSVDVVAPVQDTDDSTNNAAPQSPPYAKENLLSYSEMRDFAFSSIIPYINKELNGTITDVKRGTGEKDDAHYYIFCGRRVIGIKVVLDAYPDIYNIGKLFDDDINEHLLAKSMHEHGFECAVANIGIGANDHIRFARRIFLRNDGYYFNYQQLRFVKYNPQAGGASGIRYSLSAVEPDHEWKTLAGFDYTKPNPKPNPNADMLIQRPAPEKSKDYSKLVAHSKFWKDEEAAKKAINSLAETAYLEGSDIEALNQLIRMVAHITWNDIGLEDAFYYTCNAIDYIKGYFLADSTPVKSDVAIVALKNLLDKNKEIAEYELSLWKRTAINFLLYLFCFDRAAYAECVNGYYAATNPDDRPYSVIANKLETAFLADPTRFGYGQDVIDEIARLQNINSPQNIQKYATMRATVESEMRQFCVLHEKIVTKKTLQMLGKSEEVQLRQFSINAYELLKFAENNFDAKLAGTHKQSMAAFHTIVTVYQRCLGMDEVIISRQLRGKYRLFERMDDAKESKARFERFVAQYKK